MNNQFYAFLSRMKYINRWSLMHASRMETLSEHTLEVAVIVHALCVIGQKRFGRQVDVCACLLCALYHDAAEILTGDLPTPVKYHHDALRQAYAAVEKEAGQRLLNMLPADLAPEYAPFIGGGDNEQIRLFVKAADKLSALIKCMEEERMGNREFVRARVSTLRALEALNLPEAGVFIEEFLPAYELSLDEMEE